MAIEPLDPRSRCNATPIGSFQAPNARSMTIAVSLEYGGSVACPITLIFNALDQARHT
ncbi:hypothetical protein [Tianweitania populi]|uniref:hypothetical protein n=1 Tax=Tianweitania populi TaxID=1607949 RepID=UPI0036D7F31D